MKDTSKRHLLKTLTASSGVIASGLLLPEKWVKPAIESVLLPAHAETSATAVPDGTWEGELEFLGLTSNNNSGSVGSFVQQVADIVISPAHACLFGKVPLKIMVINDIATLSNSSQVGTSSIDDGKIKYLGVHIDGQLSNVWASYLADSDRWNVNVEGLDNAFACNGNDASGYLNRK